MNRGSIQEGQISDLYNKYNQLISGGGVPTSSNLADVLINGNSAGANDIDMNNNDITNADQITCSQLNYTTLNPPISSAGTLSQVLTAGNVATNSISLDNAGVGTNQITLLPNFFSNSPRINLTDGTTTNSITELGYTTRNSVQNIAHYLNFSDSSSTGVGAIQKTAGLSCNPSTNTITATTFIGDLTGNASSATTATNVTTTSDNTSGNYYIPFSKTTAGTSTALFLDDVTGPLTYNPSTSNLTTSFINLIGVSRGGGNLSSNTAVGGTSLTSNTTGANNTAVGNLTLQNSTTASFNVAVGFSALRNTTTGVANTALGNQALQTNTTGQSNTAVGASALQLSTATSNTAVGFQALNNTSTGGFNTAVGNIALTANTTGQINTAVGTNAMTECTTGSNNTCIGREAGNITSPFRITTQNNNVVIGDNNVTNAYIRVNWSITSDLRDKTNLKPITHGLDFVNQLKPTEFQFRKERGSEEVQEGERIHYGFIAQDILALEGDRPVIIDNREEERLKYTESNLIPVLVKAIQELTARVQALEAGK